jgi:hypothetical protein
LIFGDGGEGRTRTFEAMRRLIYSQLPLPLGTLPHLNPIASLAAAVAEISLSMTLKTENLHKGTGRARLWAKGHGKVNQWQNANIFRAPHKLP